MRLTVVHPALRRGRDHQRRFARRDLQLAFFLRDRVVVGLEVRALGVGDRVRHFTFGYRRHAARRLDIGRFAFNKAVATYRDFRLRQRRTVVRLLAALTRQRYTALRDRQRAGSIINNIIGRNAGDLCLISLSQILLGALADIGDRGSRAESSFNCLGIAAQFTGNCVLTIQRVAVIGLGLCFSRDRQRQRVVDGDDIAFGAYRDLLARVVAVDR